MTALHLDMPTLITGQVGPKVLAKAPELFNQSLLTIFNELLQNARRAGARRLDVTVTDTGDGMATVTMRDDGEGIMNPQKLLTFGDSGWDLSTDVSENAAGMGFFSLASRGARVRSVGWRATLTPAVFRGESHATVSNDPDPVNGTEISFRVHQNEKNEEHLEKAVRFYPLPVVLNGRELPRRDFLADAVHIKTWNGLRIGVLQVEPRGWSQTQPLVNFHGVTIQGGITVGQVYGPAYEARIDVVDAPDFKMVLPTRHAVIDNDFSKEAFAEAQIAVIEYLGNCREGHTLPYVTVNKARLRGITVPDATILLKPWAARNRDGSTDRDDRGELSRPVPGKSVLVGPILEDEAHTAVSLKEPLKYAKEQKGSTFPALYESQPAFEGYAEYDEIHEIDLQHWSFSKNNRAHTIDCSVENNETWHGDLLDSLGKKQDDYALGSVKETVDTLTACLAVTDRKTGKTIRTIEIPCSIALLNETYQAEEAAFLVVNGTSPGTLANILVEGYFSASDDHEADSYDTQLRYANDEAWEIAITVLEGEQAARLSLLRDSLRENKSLLIKTGITSLKVNVSHGHDDTGRQVTDMTATVMLADGTEQTWQI